MQAQMKELNVEGQNIFVGLYVQLKGWNTSIFTDSLHHKTFNGPPKPVALLELMQYKL